MTKEVAAQQLREAVARALVQQGRSPAPAQMTQFLSNHFTKWSAGKPALSEAQFVASLSSLGLRGGSGREVFMALDQDRSGQLTVSELCALVGGLGPTSALKGMTPRGAAALTPRTMRTTGNAIISPGPLAGKSGLGGLGAPPGWGVDGQRQPPASLSMSGMQSLGGTGKMGGSSPFQEETELDLSDMIVEKFRQVIVKRGGSSGIHGLGRIFKVMDDDGNKKLNAQELYTGLKDYGLKMSGKDIAMLLDALDKEDKGSVSFDEFMIAIRGTINKRRKSLIMLAFDVLDKTKDGYISADDIARCYDASHHPEVIAGKMTPQEGMTNFLKQFDSIEKDGRVTRDEFVEYYKNVSASIDDDDYFELMIRNAWHLPGGRGQYENTANARVLVTFADGSQRILMIEDDLGLDLRNSRAVLARLKAQGVKNAVSYSLSGAS